MPETAFLGASKKSLSAGASPQTPGGAYSAPSGWIQGALLLRGGDPENYTLLRTGPVVFEFMYRPVLVVVRQTDRNRPVHRKINEIEVEEKAFFAVCLILKVVKLDVMSTFSCTLPRKSRVVNVSQTESRVIQRYGSAKRRRR